MSAAAILVTLFGSLITSFLGSFLCFVIWVHFNLERHWENHKEANRLKDIQHGWEIENERRLRAGQRPLPRTFDEKP